MDVVKNANKATLLPLIETNSAQKITCYTDEYKSYAGIRETGRLHKTVEHGIKEWARDDDGDGINEVHTNTIEGLWTGLRNYLRPFRGIHKKYLDYYCAVFEWTFNAKKLNTYMVKCACYSFSKFPT